MNGEKHIPGQISLSEKIKQIAEEEGINHVFLFGPQFSIQLQKQPILTNFLTEKPGLPLPLRFLRFADEHQNQHILIWLSDRNFLDHAGMMSKLGVEPTAIADAGLAIITGSSQSPEVRFGGDNIIMRLFNAGGPLEIRRQETERVARQIAPTDLTVTSSVHGLG